MMTPKVAIPVIETAMAAVDRKDISNASDGKNSFDMLMNRNIQKNKEISGTGKEASSKKTAINEKQGFSIGKKDNSLQKSVSTVNGSIETSKNTVDGSNESLLEIEEGTIPDEVIEAISQLEQMILINVANELGISQEELTSQLEAIGMTAFDLLDTDNLKEFVLNFNGFNNPVDFLMNEDLAKQLNDLVNLLEQLPEKEMNLSKQEVFELSSLAEQLHQIREEVSDVESEDFTDLQSDTQAGISDSEATETIPVTVTKENTTEENNSQGNQKERAILPEKNATPLDTFVQNLSVHQNSGLENMEQIFEQTQLMKDIVNQIVEQIKIAIKPESTSMELQLNPEHLGKISLTVVEKNGEMTASFIAQNHAAKEAIESQIQTLKDNLNNQGLKVEAVEVTVSEFGFKQDTQAGNGTGSQDTGKSKDRSNRRKIDLSILDENQEEATEEELLAARVLKDNGGSIDYTA
ncbi:flagellar hook-length control protein FliK [Velocimicrobium porci]|uniref:Flagellar hook-length control protein-like C-terminal domain-containing protein n=1 Tax=Velocimicrobium porci TaxID=2606634 RepID=A0A6L5XX37_9FIRM|nr:flagellar hook-length control protein FliK [Velocimicrobium porci]MSS63011.1 hypothetical protein [Velocimicrobium porci]